MCKFNNRLFVFSIICSLLALLKVRVLAKPLHEPQKSGSDELNELMAISALLAPQDNYDLHYDQRQKGEENYRIKLDGFFIGLPQEESSSLLLLTDDIFENIGEYGTNDDFLLAFGKNKSPSGAANPSLSSSSALLSTPERLTPSSSLDVTQKLSPSISQNAANKFETVIVEIPTPKKPSEARQRMDLEPSEELPYKSISKTKSYISHLVNLLKRGRKN